MKKKILVALVMVGTLALCLTACGKKGEKESEPNPDDSPTPSISAVKEPENDEPTENNGGDVKEDTETPTALYSVTVMQNLVGSSEPSTECYNKVYHAGEMTEEIIVPKTGVYEGCTVEQVLILAGDQVLIENAAEDTIASHEVVSDETWLYLYQKKGDVQNIPSEGEEIIEIPDVITEETGSRHVYLVVHADGIDYVYDKVLQNDEEFPGWTSENYEDFELTYIPRCKVSEITTELAPYCWMINEYTDTATNELRIDLVVKLKKKLVWKE